MDLESTTGTPPPQIDCFTTQAHLSGFLDNSLIPDVQEKLTAHLKQCKPCALRHQHFTLLVETIKNQPKHTVPSTLKRPLFFFRIPWVSKWEHIPWYLRLLIETTGIILLILFGISIVPEVRSLYENQLEKRLSDFRDGLAGGKPQLEDLDVVVGPANESGDAIEGEDETPEKDDVLSPKQTELWRFTLKTVSPDELRPVILKILEDLNIPTPTNAQTGVQVPGGVEFDLLVPRTEIANLKTSLEKIVSQTNTETDNKTPSSTDLFTWYKVKYKQKLPEGQVKAVIWLSQPNQ